MIPRLHGLAAATPAVLTFLEALRQGGFSGDMSSTAADRTVLATDNSVYQVAPEAVLFPRSAADLSLVTRLLARRDCETVVLRPRGGGTGTNGQALGEGVVVDVSRHMNRILEIDAAAGWVRVEPGVVKDQLNAALKPHGLFFAPELSTSNRATIGGMISTDACGQGSCLYGKTRDHVLALDIVLSDGTLWHARPMEEAELAAAQARTDRVGEIHRTVDAIARDNAALIAERFPKLNRCLTGYDLAHIRDAQGRFDLNAVICGSEGTLGLIAEAKLRVLPIPRASALVALRYASFDAVLRDAATLAGFGAASIETIDSKVLDLARGDIIWTEVGRFFPEEPGAPVRGIALVEFVGDSAEAVMAAVARCTAALDADAGPGGARLGHAVATGAAVESLWTMRKKAVGLLGNVKGAKRPVAFVEDTAVPPDRLADYVAEFRAALDRRGLAYGMFGHVDAGVLHVRPALDLKDPAQERLIRDVTEEVVALTARYGGLLWGEHGKGVRSEFVPAVFGPLYPCLVAIKSAFDPGDRLNPGKIASALGRPLLTVDGVPFKGGFDRQVPEAVRAGYDEALHCNGNGACFNHDVDDAMCPSWKVTRERRHSPKGRSALVREWLRLLAEQGVDPLAPTVRRSSGLGTLPRRIANSWRARRGEADFSHEVKEALDGCLACKACAGQCPIKVDVPTFRAKVFELYHTRYLRRPRDHLVAGLERMLPLAALAPRLFNALAGSGPASRITARLGIVDPPRLSGLDLAAELRRRGIGFATPEALAGLSPERRAKSVVLVQDAFTSFLETGVVLDLVDLLTLLGFTPWVAPFRPNGKALHVHGFLDGFARTARRNAAHLGALGRTGVPLVGVDPSMTLTYRSDYRGALGTTAPTVWLPQEWLATRLDELPDLPRQGEVRLLPHCTERTNAAASMADWVKVFGRLGLGLRIVPAGCCGMAGTYGHEAEHRGLSAKIFRQGWERHLAAEGAPLAVTGYSCRSQAARFGTAKPPHPATLLLERMRQGRGVSAETQDGERQPP